MKKLKQQELENIRNNPNSVDWKEISSKYELTEDFISE